MQRLFLLTLSLMLTACSVAQIPQKITRHQAQHQFFAALDEFSETDRIALLKQLQLDYPEGAWAARAETIILYAEELDTRKRQIESLGEEKERLAKKLSQLQTTNQQLQEKLEQLKSVLIELEQLPQ